MTNYDRNLKVMLHYVTLHCNNFVTLSLSYQNTLDIREQMFCSIFFCLRLKFPPAFSSSNRDICQPRLAELGTAGIQVIFNTLISTQFSTFLTTILKRHQHQQNLK